MSLADEPPLRDLPDRAIRQGLQHPEHLRDLLRRDVPNPSAPPWWRKPEASQHEVIRQHEVDAMSTRITGTIADIAMAKGKAEGMAEGEAKGQLQSRREDLLAILEERFGVVPADVSTRISAISDIEQLRRAIRQAVKVQNLEELQL
jgi:hypothetical protein